ncbi:glycosyltransferase [Cellulophaga baltica]|uniref:glycosyltransferase n=1 Tax=Cellulophaga baltica TaxID=76594 RepID=UPI00249473AC|nr:glycosyltransferase [Cellulophaga baltica]
MQPKKEILLIIPSLTGGGAEKVFLKLCKYLDKNKYNITLCLLKKEGEFVTLLNAEDGYRVHNLNISRVRYAIFPLLAYIRKLKPNVVVSTLGHLNALLAVLIPFLPKKTTIVAREANIVSKKQYNYITMFLYKTFYKKFHYIIGQSDDMIKDLMFIVNIKHDQIIKINNPINYIEIENSLNNTNKKLLPLNKINLLSVGSLTYQKGYDLLLNSFSKFKDINDYHLTILGKGELHDELVELCKKLEIESNVTFAGFIADPYPYMSESDIFISSSRFEGFPNAVLEALACDTPVISNNYLGGINEIINDPLYGKIIDIANDSVFEDSCLLVTKMDQNKNSIKNNIIERYGLEIIIKKYESFFDSL